MLVDVSFAELSSEALLGVEVGGLMVGGVPVGCEGVVLGGVCCGVMYQKSRGVGRSESTGCGFVLRVQGNEIVCGDVGWRWSGAYGGGVVAWYVSVSDQEYVRRGGVPAL